MTSRPTDSLVAAKSAEVFISIDAAPIGLGALRNQR